MDKCDNKSVGVIIQNSGEFLLLQRARFPWGLAPPAGHIDEHGTEIDTALAEVREEVGINLEINSLVKVIKNRRIYNACRRPGGNYHDWTVYIANSDSKLTIANKDETNGLYWLSPEELQALASDTRNINPNNINIESKVFEKIWLDFFVELKLIS